MGRFYTCICFNTPWISFLPPLPDTSPAFYLFTVHTSTIADLVFLELRRLLRILINCSGAAVSTHARKQTHAHTVSDFSHTHVPANRQRLPCIATVRAVGGGKLEGTACAGDNTAESKNYGTLWTRQQRQHTSPAWGGVYVFLPLRYLQDSKERT